MILKISFFFQNCPGNSTNNGTVCNECCSSDICNAKACGEPGSLIYQNLDIFTLRNVGTPLPFRLKWTLSSLNLVITTVPNRGLCQKLEQNGKKCRS